MAASAIFSTPGRTTTICSLSTSSSTSLNFRTPQFGLTHFPQYRWTGLRQVGFPISQQSLKLERRSKSRSKVIVASLFGVGAPEALVIGVVALLVFGPKGLAEVARNLGKTLRAFQPTIRELQDVSREFKTTLEKEIGLDEIQNPMRSNYSSTPTTPISRPAPVVTPEDSLATIDPSSTPTTPISRPAPVATPEDSQATSDPSGTPSPNKAYSTEDYLKITEEQLKAAASVQQEEQQTLPPVAGTKLDPQSQAQDTLQEGAGATPPVQKPKDES